MTELVSNASKDGNASVSAAQLDIAVVSKLVDNGLVEIQPDLTPKLTLPAMASLLIVVPLTDGEPFARPRSPDLGLCSVLELVLHLEVPG